MTFLLLLHKMFAEPTVIHYLRTRDRAHEVLMNSHLQTKRKRAESAIQRITKDMQTRSVPG